MPSFDELENPDTNIATEIISSDGVTLGKFYKENRTPVKYHELPQHIVKALVATEDERFYEHSGIDAKGTLRAVVKLGRDGGASTLTQQLAKNLFLAGERTFVRKGQEFVLTLMLEALLPKQRILELYLNHVEWGEGVFGAEAAAQHYFAKSAAQLSPWEAGRLAVMLPRPKHYQKFPLSEYLAGRTEIILTRMPRAQLP
jgi:penicillin-binding protein 1A